MEHVLRASPAAGHTVFGPVFFYALPKNMRCFVARVRSFHRLNSQILLPKTDEMSRKIRLQVGTYQPSLYLVAFSENQIGRIFGRKLDCAGRSSSRRSSPEISRRCPRWKFGRTQSDRYNIVRDKIASNTFSQKGRSSATPQ